jgi:integrase/recombinase XerD
VVEITRSVKFDDGSAPSDDETGIMMTSGSDGVDTRSPISPQDTNRHYVEHLLKQMLDDGYAGNTVSIQATALSVFYREIGFDDDNPALNTNVSDWSALKKGTKKEQHANSDDVHYLKPDDVQKLADNVPSPVVRNKLLVLLLYQTGMRRSEAAPVRLDNIDQDARSIDIRADKTEDNRTVYYQPNLDFLMNQWIEVDRKSLPTADSPYLFNSFKSYMINNRHISSIVKKAADNAGLQESLYKDQAGKEHSRVSSHTLRHSFGVQSIKNGMDTRSLQLLMGHSQISTTEKYLKLTKDDLASRARKFGAGTERTK